MKNADAKASAGVVVVRRPPVVVVAPRARVCPGGFVWRYGRCHPY